MRTIFRNASASGAHSAALAAAALALTLAALAWTAPAAAQTIRDKMVTDNPSRTPGGSCIYGGDGKLIHAPRGSLCPEYQEGTAPAPAAIAEDAAPPKRATAPVSTQPPAARTPLPSVAREDVAALLAERERLDVELARMREAIGYEDREAARAAIEASLGRIARHLENEARVLQPMVAGQ
jgi:hypothetical protein